MKFLRSISLTSRVSFLRRLDGWGSSRVGRSKPFSAAFEGEGVTIIIRNGDASIQASSNSVASMSV